MEQFNIEWKDIKNVKPYARNAKKHDEIQVANVAESIKQFGWQQPIVCDADGVIIIGHCRLLAAKKLGLKKVPVKTVDNFSDEQVKKLRNLDNKLNESEWDFDLLAQDIDGLDFSGFDVDWGLPADVEETEIVEDEAPEVDEENEPITKLGDIWQLGRHKLICGDSTDKATVERLMDGAKADMVFTDPPYNMSNNFDTSTINLKKLQKRVDNIVDFDPNTISFIKDIGICSFYIFTSKNLIPKYFKIFEDFDFNLLVWCKDNPTPLTNYTFLPDVEYLLYFSKKGKIWNNGLKTDIYKKYYNSNKMEGRKEAGDVHPTIKPLKIICDKIQISSNQNGIVLDLFGGSGSTLIACEQLGRRCFTMELDPKYCDVIIKRWENLTGKKAVKIN